MKNLKNERKITGLFYKELLKYNISIPVDFLAIDYDKYSKKKIKLDISITLFTRKDRYCMENDCRIWLDRVIGTGI
jgi:hypothetical protein